MACMFHLIKFNKRENLIRTLLFSFLLFLDVSVQKPDFNGARSKQSASLQREPRFNKSGFHERALMVLKISFLFLEGALFVVLPLYSSGVSC